MIKDKIRSQKAVQRDLKSAILPVKIPLQKILFQLKGLILEAIKTGDTQKIVQVCNGQMLELLNAATEVSILKGARRGQLSSEKVIDEPTREIAPVRFSFNDRDNSQAKGVIQYLQRVSGIKPQRTKDAFKLQNASMINGLSQEICDTIRKSIDVLTRQGMHVKGGTLEISKALATANLAPTLVPQLAETIFRTQSAQAYNAGRWNVVNDSDVGSYIWGFEYVTVGDDRVRPEHRLLEGVRLAKDDPFWKKYLPPNGWNCRCTVLEIWKDEEIAQEDFGITGRDPRTRTDEELNLMPAFAGNTGIFASGTPNNILKYYQIQGVIDNVNRSFSKYEKKSQIVIIKEDYDFAIQDEKGYNLGFAKQTGIELARDGGGNWEFFWGGISKGIKTMLGFLKSAVELFAKQNGIEPQNVLVSYEKAVNLPKPNEFPETPDELEVIKENIGGSIGASLCQDKYGNQFIRKRGGEGFKVPSQHLQSECSADAFYRAMGIDVPEFKSYQMNGKTIKLSRNIENKTDFCVWWRNASDTQKEEMREKLIPGFAADILLGNWDVLGASGDNIIVDSEGKPWRIDNGGSLSFRAQGAKKDKTLWEDGWPDDIWTMRGKNPDGSNFQFKNQWTEEVFGNLTTCNILETISKKDWTPALDKLNAEDRKVVEKRLVEIRQLASRALPFRDDGFKEESVETITSHSYRLSKEGFREAVPPKVELDKTGWPKDFGFFRSKNPPTASTVTPIDEEQTVTTPNDSSLWTEIIRDAVKTINYHISIGNSSVGYNWTKINRAVALKTKLQDLLVQNPGNAETQYCLGWINAIEKKSKAKKTKVPLKQFNDSVQLPIYIPQPPAPH